MPAVVVHDGPNRVDVHAEEGATAEDVLALYLSLTGAASATLCSSSGPAAGSALASSLPSPLVAIRSFTVPAARADEVLPEGWVREAVTEMVTSSCSRVCADGTVRQPMVLVGPLGGTLVCAVCAVCAGMCVLPTVPRRPMDAAAAPAECACGSSQAAPSCLFAERHGAECRADGMAAPGSDLAVEVHRQLRVAASKAANAAADAAVRAAASADPSAAASHFASRVAGAAKHMWSYTSPAFVEKALRTMPLVQMQEKATAAFEALQGRWNVAAEPAVPPPVLEAARVAAWRDCLLNELVRWYKYDFFKWVNAPPCDGCGGGTACTGGAAPTAAEAAAQAGVVEMYACSAACGVTTRFPRYNNVCTLLDWRRGRCGEWANCFTGLCLVLGFDTRHVTDWTDHVWTEVWSPHRRAWLHVDSCEAAVDTPLLYEAGWGKKLSYVLACSLEEVVDVSRRYTKDWEAGQGRRTLVGEEWLARLLAAASAAQAARSALAEAPARASAVAIRRAREERQMAAHAAWGAQEEGGKSALSGRISGSLEWRAARDELGAGLAGGVGRQGGVRRLEGHTGEWQSVCSAFSGSAAGERSTAVGGWGEHALAWGPQGMQWRSLPPPPGWTAGGAAEGDGQWRDLRGEGGSAWPPPGQTVIEVSLACDPTACVAYGLTAEGSALTVWRILPRGAGVHASVAATFAAAGSDGTSPARVPMAFVRPGVLALVLDGALWTIAVGGADPSAQPSRVCSAERVRCLAVTRSGLLLAWRAAEDAQAVGAAGELVLLADGRPKQSPPAMDAVVGVPIHVDAAVASPSTRLRVRVVAPPPPGAFLAWTRAGFPPQSVGRGHTLEADELGTDGVACFDGLLCAGCSVPSAPGVYELRLVDGDGTRVLGAAVHDVAVVEGGAAGPAFAWLPLRPLSGVTALLPGPASGGVFALTDADELVFSALPRALAVGAGGALRPFSLPT